MCPYAQELAGPDMSVCRHTYWETMFTLFEESIAL